ncbi:FMN-binding negative transcriptional regulator [Bacilli bacterium]|uniref:FMN-binding negative transcriptional regulator n=1 Tax=Oceanobacillus sp. FSL K6-0118 TaxID=2921418 RepID=UPI0006210209|nr:transcriptional regulator [Bacilli bacterium VT-13-104]PZD83099.1 FMN-binding negative transcriptional regulator [Bacilli bacterium]PZD83920.1 FMN-binding negative transcriptional regulator [Bacilli bacterium]PZD85838.1 FMN-binding negative transcriptional regulator [Bacilli bacterium]RCO04717.1 FMN-binding negative transcriptional regulator [Bacilli bacterium]
MFIPSHFLIQDDEELYQMIEEYGFATLFSLNEGEPTATQIPLMMNEDRKYLYGHFARSNPQWKDINQQRILAIFNGPHCYISPSWYETNRAVPTWNYVTVHVYGHVELVEGKELEDSLKELVLKYEGSDSSYQLDEVESKYMEAQTKGVVGFKIKIDKMEGKAKLSQNHPQKRQRLIIQELEQSGREDEQKIASYMKRNLEAKK